MSTHLKFALLASGLFLTATASAQTNPYQKGPAPTTASLEASAGPFLTRMSTLSAASVSGFGGGALHYPSAAGSYGAIAICPGFTARSSSLSWLGPRLASHGFVVLIIDTNSTMDQPAARGRQLKAALDHLVRLSGTRGNVLFGKVDAGRLAVSGHSMGGGGALEAVRDNPSYKAGFPMAPYGNTTSFPTIRVPTMIVSGQSDTVAIYHQYTAPVYFSIPNTTPKALMELANANQLFPTNPTKYSPLVGKYAVSWMKRFVDNDTRFSPFLCGAPHQADVADVSKISRYLENCPY